MSAWPLVRRSRCALSVRSMLSVERASGTASKLQSVREIAHTSSLHSEKSCGSIRLRVQSIVGFGCSMRWSNKQRSITELNSDSQSKKSTVKLKGRQHTKAIRSCVPAPSKKFGRSSAAPNLLQALSFLRAAGSSPAVAMARLSRSSRLARCPQFISVSGPRAARSALHSDLRLKRTSGFAAATPQLHAPMNSPEPRATTGACHHRVSINQSAIA
jgi:hypothetical protein